MAQTFEKIKATTDKQLIELADAACNAHARGGGLDLKPILEVQLLLNEVAKRDQDRATQAMLQLTQEMHEFTKQMRNLTWIILGATIASVVVSIIALLKVS